MKPPDTITVKCAGLPEVEERIQAAIAQMAGAAKTIETLAKLVWEGTERCLFCRGRECDWCVDAKVLLTSLGFYDAMRKWAGR